MSIQTSDPRFASSLGSRVRSRYRRDFRGDSAVGDDFYAIDIAAGEGLALPAPARTLSLGVGASYFWQVAKTSLPLLAADLVALVLCCSVAAAACSLVASWSPALELFGMFWPLVLMQPLIGASIGLYPGVGLTPSAELRLTSLATTLWVGVLALLNVARASDAFVVLVLTWVLAVASIPLARSFGRMFASKFSWWGFPTIVLGGGPEAAIIYRSMLANPSRGLRPVGLIEDPHAHWNDPHVDPSWYLGAPAATASIVDEMRAFWGVIPLGPASSGDVASIMDRHAAIFPHLLVLRDASLSLRAWDGACDCGGLIGLRIDERLLLPQSQFIKRAVDFAFAMLSGILLLPILGLIAVGVKLSSPGPVLCGQEYVGRRGKRFTVRKFRTTVAVASESLRDRLNGDSQVCVELGQVENSPITGFGHWLRRLGLDELPQLWNVLVGDMSFVGPRPILEDEIGHYGDAFQLYARVRPGITGMWNSGRNLASYGQRVHLDATYVRNWSPWLDLCVLARAARIALFGESAY